MPLPGGDQKIDELPASADFQRGQADYPAQQINGWLDISASAVSLGDDLILFDRFGQPALLQEQVSDGDMHGQVSRSIQQGIQRFFHGRTQLPGLSQLVHGAERFDHAAATRSNQDFAKRQGLLLLAAC